jgi:CTP synthase (UTP-ammonia lyase)
MGGIALIGDYQPDVIAHQGIERSLRLARESRPGLRWKWIHTSTLTASPHSRLEEFAAIWLVPASPYANEPGVFAAIRWARENQVPFLGTCGGFQHAVLEYARNVLQYREAGHAETDPAGSMLLISPLQCSLVEERGAVHVVPGSRLDAMYGGSPGEESYHCTYGINPDYAGLFEGDLRVAALDTAGEIRAVELITHRFFIGTLFQPERRALAGVIHPVVQAFIQAAG